jgi:hypothetical protein
MESPFGKMKAAARDQFQRLRTIMQPDLGTHKRTRLTQAGCEGSGSLLHDDVARRHAELLARDFLAQFGHEHPQQLRFVTVLHSVTGMNEGEVLRAAASMERNIRLAFSGTGVACTGVTEVEAVNLRLMRRAGSPQGSEYRKLRVLEKLLPPSDDDLEFGILVHFHGVLDLRNSILCEAGVRDLLRGVEDWRRAPFQIEVKKLFASRSTADNLKNIAAYVTKGGNDTLRYNLGFGRDLDGDLDARVWRAGTGRADKGAETVTDERSLSFAAIALLDRVWIGLMIRRADDRGYVLRTDGL